MHDDSCRPLSSHVRLQVGRARRRPVRPPDENRLDCSDIPGTGRVGDDVHRHHPRPSPGASGLRGTDADTPSGCFLALLASRTLPHGTWWWKSLVLGALNMACFFPLLFVAAQRLPGGVAATLGAAQPIIVAGFAVAVLGERLSAWRLIWGVVGVVGIALVVLGPQAQLDALGVAAGLGGAASMGLGVVLTKRWGRPEGVSALGLAGWQLTGAGLLLIVPALIIDGVPTGIDTAAVAGYAWLGLVGGLAAYVLWFEGIRRLPVTPTALLGLLSPLNAALLGHVIADEALTSFQFLGFALALTAMSAGQLALPSSRSSS